ncbi:peptidase M15 [Paenibacillus oryzae]|uniref:serine-type D-Ala-D-Ala carboxypeptidase n=1 Tax=Paenibacillus oryzae TaxID=1844972 RepID=A0A1A5YME8_9BACL|nr:D-alanyl-D-alanine carboxypeptidase family protein [Paenibacillus oryzae]OBR66713.1 peptidase M15 [Paenibacillus oryzae]
MIVKAKGRPFRFWSLMAACLMIWTAVLSQGASTALAVGYNNRPSTENALGLQVKAAILIEADSGQVLFQVNPDEALPLASMTKLMTEYIVLKEISTGRLSWDEKITVSADAANTLPIESQIYLAAGDIHTVKELYTAMAVGSANDATKQLAITVAGSIDGFVAKMNETAKELGLTTAVFHSTTGFEVTETEELSVMSAGDIAKLARVILKEHPEFLEFSSISKYQFRTRDKSPIVNINSMLQTHTDAAFKPLTYQGVDGMKTGFTEKAGYNFAGTVMRNDLRFISVVMDTATKNTRFYETAKLYDYAYGAFEKKTALPPKTVVEGLETVKIKKGVNKTVPIVTDKDITFIVKKDAEPKIEMTASQVMPEEELIAPLAAGTKVGTVTYTYSDEATGKDLSYTVNLVTAEKAEKAGWFKLFFRAIGDFFAGLFDSIVNLF